MTREEAIELLDILPWCNECDSSNFPYTCAECGDAFLLAMEALKQPEVVRCYWCKYWDTYNVECMKGHHPRPPYNTWFCADGERKEGR